MSMSKEEVRVVMDEAAKVAKEELPQIETVNDIALWMKRNFPKAGYKRLGRLLAGIAVE